MFRIDEIREAEDAASNADAFNYWLPSTEPGANVRIHSPTSGGYFMCDGQKIYRTSGPRGALYKTFSLYYSQGFWVMEGDATTATGDQPWRRLNFDWEPDYSSFLSNAGQRSRLAIQRSDQYWPRMLLPDIYHAQRQTPHTSYGGLIGELPIFLALMAFSINRDYVEWVMTNCFVDGQWRTHNHRHGRRYQSYPYRTIPV